MLRTSRRIALLSTLTACFAAFPQGAIAQARDSIGDLPRLALVIGNSRYAGAALNNPAHDAEDIASALRDLGFEVVVGIDQSKTDMNRLIREFSENLRTKQGVGFFFYAGHGVQIDGHNYLIPVGADIAHRFEVQDEAVDAQRVYAAMEEAHNPLNIIVLDACRDDPFTRSFAPRGLAPAERAPLGGLIAYSTAPGKTADDGPNRNGLYTEELLRFIRTRGLRIEDVFILVRNAVLERSNEQQEPWELTALRRIFVLAPGTLERAIVPTADSGDSLRVEAELGPGFGPFRLGMAPAEVNRFLTPPYGSVAWSTLPIATEYRSTGVRYFWRYLRELRTQLPFASLYTNCLTGQSNLVFLFDDEGLFRISLRFYPDCPDHQRIISSVAERYGLEMRPWAKGRYFRAEGRQFTFVGIANSTISSLEWIRRGSPKEENQEW